MVGIMMKSCSLERSCVYEAAINDMGYFFELCSVSLEKKKKECLVLFELWQAEMMVSLILKKGFLLACLFFMLYLILAMNSLRAPMLAYSMLSS